MAWPSPAADETSMNDPHACAEISIDEEARLETEGAFELTPPDTRWWLEQEKKLVRLMAERRIQEATDLVTSYEAGSLTPEVAYKRWSEYHSRWPTRII